jgi:hypothetical protein
MPPPTGLNTSHWWSLLTLEQERAIVERTRVRARPCAVRNRRIAAAWKGREPLPSGRPLIRYIETEFVPAHAVGDYEILHRRG